METPRSTDNVVSIFAKKDEETSKEKKKPVTEQDAYEIFLEAMKKNKTNVDRLRKERNKANKGVLRSYRITDK